MSIIDLFLLDDSNNPKEEISMIKPATYQDFLVQIKHKFKTLPKFFDIFFYDENNIIKINNEQNYLLIANVYFIKESKKNVFVQSTFEHIYPFLPPKDKEKLDEKYNCIICKTIIKHQNPFLCYQCQSIFHEQCLKQWDAECKSKNKNLECPSCRNQLPLEKWNKRVHYEENRKDDAHYIDKINKLKEQNQKQLYLIKKYEAYIKKTIKVFKDILIQINSIHSLMKLKNDIRLNNLIKMFPLNFDNLYLDFISNLIDEEFGLFIHSLKKNKKDEILLPNNISGTNFNLINNNNLNNNTNNFHYNIIPMKINLNKLQMNEYQNEITLKYYPVNKGNHNIFGKIFVENNRNNIDLLINNKHHVLTDVCELEEGENNVKLMIKNKLTNLSHMFSFCNTLIDISEIKNLDVTNVRDFSYMFSECLSLSDITSLQNWDVSNAYTLWGMFSGCYSLSDINPLQNWNVSNIINFSSMFDRCPSLSDITPLQYWNVINSRNFQNMFYGCSSLSDLTPLQNWNVTFCNNFSGMFSGCKSLKDIKPLQYWNVSNVKDFSYMFHGCLFLSDIEPIRNWNVSKGKNFMYMFSRCSPGLDITPIHSWNVTNEKIQFINKDD